MAACAEALNILHHANVGKTDRESDAETSPPRNPEHYEYDFNLSDVTEVWQRGSVIASWIRRRSKTSLAALFQRFTSRGENDFANKSLSAMRFQFGGHVERTSGG